MADASLAVSTGTANSVAFVPIRDGSKGFPGKNVRLFAGLPLYEHAVRQGLRCCGGCVISTDIESVLNMPVGDGRVLHRRPAMLASDAAVMDAVIADSITSLSLQGRTIVLLQATSPLRGDEHVRAAIELHRSGAFELVLSVVLGDRSILKAGTIVGDRFAPISRPEYCFTNRQSLPEVYRPNGAVYVFSADWFLTNGGLAAASIGALVMPLEQSQDIDTEADFRLAEALFSAPSSGRAGASGERAP